MDKEELKKKLTEEEYKVTQEKGTEAPFTGKYLDTTEKGMYNCKVCGNKLFSSEAKYHSSATGLAGWPSFNEAIPGSIEYVPDTSGGMNRIEIVCAKCKAHLGHVFDEAEAKNGKHYCLNSCALDLAKE